MKNEQRLNNGLGIVNFKNASTPMLIKLWLKPQSDHIFVFL